MKKGMQYWLRWFGVLPISILGGLIVTFPLHWILYQTLSGGENPFISPYPELPEKILQPFFTGLVFVWISFHIAPQFKFKTALIHAAIWIFVAGGGFFLSFFSSNSETKTISIIDFIPLVSGIFGIIACLYLIKKGLSFNP